MSPAFSTFHFQLRIVAYGWVEMVVYVSVKTASLKHSLSLTYSNPTRFEEGHGVRGSLLVCLLLLCWRALVLSLTSCGIRV